MNTVIAPPGFDAVAHHYDAQVNPLLALEERYLSALLPSVEGTDVVEVGCGTGRWLQKLTQGKTRTLTGVDASEKMLEVARAKLGNAHLVCGRAEQIPLPDDAADLILLPFVMSYCADLSAVAREVARLAKPGAMVYLSDVHPETESRLGWRRTFPGDCGTMTMATVRHSIVDVVKQFERAGFDAAVQLEPTFGEPEAAHFERAGRPELLEAIGVLPAIYLLQFVSPSVVPANRLHYRGARVALSGSTSCYVEIGTDGEKIATIGLPGQDGVPQLDLSGCMILPGLINAHDHLEFGLYPNLGRGSYANATEWAHDIQRRERETIRQHERVPKEVRLYFGALRNLLCGVTTVCHHNPEASVFREPAFPVHVLRDIDWAHSLAFDRAGVEGRKKSKRMFAVHAAEGVDEASSREIEELCRVGALHERTVLVHALGCWDGDVNTINAQGAAVVVCPSSNQFLYGRTLSAKRFAQLDRVALGTDSPLTAGGDLLEEVRCARNAWQASAEKLYAMCTTASAHVFGLCDGSGQIRVHGRADLVVVSDLGLSPAETLVALTSEQIELVVIAGCVHLASDHTYGKLPQRSQAGLAPLMVEGTRRWVRAPLRWMFEEAEAVLGGPIILGGKRVAYAG